MRHFAVVGRVAAVVSLPVSKIVTALLALALSFELPGVPWAQSTPLTAGSVTMSPAEGSAGPPPPTESEYANRGQTKPLGQLTAGTSADDDENSTPTAWWIYGGQSPTDVNNTLATLNARIVDIIVDSFSPSYSFTVTYVQNTGSYAKTWWWYYGVDATAVSHLLTANNARPIALKAYDIGGGTIRFAVVMISNTGADAKAYWWYYGQSANDISNLVNANNARLTRIDQYTDNGQTVYAVVMISNTGTDARAWWWYVDVTPAQISGLVTANNARLLDLNSAGGGNFNAIMESCSSGCPEWWWYYGETGSQILNLAQQNGARIVTADTYPGCGGSCFVAVMINNSNAITTRVGNILRANGIGGVQGLYLKPVSGSVLANLEDAHVYEPASSIKVVAHLYALTQIENGNDTLAEAITHYTNAATSCPDPATISGTEPLSTALQEMMWHSDNARTREITDFFGDSKINAFAKNIGMTNTSINHIIGCGGPTADTMTLDDAATLYEGVANRTLLNDTDSGTFYSLMAGKAEFAAEGYDFTHIWDTDVPNLINEEAPSGATTAQKQAYQYLMDLAYKAGGYVICQNAGCTSVLEHLSVSGWFKVPFCTTGVITHNEYVFGIFLSAAPDLSWFSGKVTVADTNFGNAKGELLREQLHAGLASFGDTGCASPTPTSTATAIPRASSTPTATPTRTPTNTLTSTPSETPTPTLPRNVCVGDCDGNGQVTVDELLTLVNIALGNAPPSACPHGVPSGASVDVALIIQAVNNALNGCGA